MDDEDERRRTRSLAALAVTLLLLVAGLFLIHVLHDKGAVEDCMMAGRHDCDRVLAAPH